MWTAKDRTKSVHNSEVSHMQLSWTKLYLQDKYIGKIKRAGRKVSTVVRCPQGEVLLYIALAKQGDNALGTAHLSIGLDVYTLLCETSDL